ncbi:M28 family peptidase [Siminovitchia acidinfaciens]|uniref:M28 family peptidase n=1 Tax=Siminovitchia acidinfaciens TaxID=2321395 RepID=A0A429XWG7_9BACI|nr:M28 family peptidase [Siminovitchia acidinfaciens]RST72736.1 M28 family peptidase [Siminovitchia acidinfaciens]
MKIRRFGTLMSAVLISSTLVGFSPKSIEYSQTSSTPIVQEESQASIVNMQALIDRLEKDGEITSAAVARALKTHITAVGHYESSKSYKKAIKHMESFHVLLNNYEKTRMISGNAANLLSEYADALIGQWDVIFDSERVMDHIRELSVEIGTRVPGSEGEKQAAEYLKNQFQSLGYETSIQEFAISNRTERTLKILTNKNKEIALGAATGSAGTGENGVTGDIYNAGLGLPGDFSAAAKGKIALIQRGDNTFQEKVQNATNAGAIGVVIYDNVDTVTPLRPTLNGNSTIPVVGTTKELGESLLAQLSKGTVKGKLVIHTFSNQTSQNVVAVKKPANVVNPKIVYITSHYDSVNYSPGANDDASGTGTIVEMARILKNSLTDKELRFVAFGAEEIGLVGSNYYVKNLPQADIDRSEINFQMEMLGSKYEPGSYLAFNTVDGKTNIAWDYTNAAFDKQGKDKEKLILFRRGSSDHVPFHNAGIIASCFNMGTKSGGLEPEYHTYRDTIENVSPERIQFAGDVISATIWDYLVDHSFIAKEIKDAS